MKTNFLSKAAAIAKRGIDKNAGGPFGAVLVRRGKILAQAHNTVLKEKNPTAHAEINAIEVASKKLSRFHLTDVDLYTTTEPCPMCFSAIHWAKIKKVVYATTITDVKRLGFNELSISAKKMKHFGKSPVVVKQEPNKECKNLLQQWKNKKKKRVY